MFELSAKVPPAPTRSASEGCPGANAIEGPSVDQIAVLEHTHLQSQVRFARRLIAFGIEYYEPQIKALTGGKPSDRWTVI